MNKIYKVVWSKVKNCYVVVSELAKNVITGSVKSAKVGAAPMAKGLALGAVMAFVITGNAMAADQYKDLNNEKNIVVSEDTGHDNPRLIGGNYITTREENGNYVTTPETIGAVDSSFEVNGGDWNMVVGGHYAQNVNKTSEVVNINAKSTDVTISGGSVKQVVAGSGGTDNDNLVISGDSVTTKLTITSGEIGGVVTGGDNCPELLVIGGDLIKDGGWTDTAQTGIGATSKIQSTNTTIEGGNFQAAIIGGSASSQYYGKLYNDAKTGLNSGVGTANLTINGGTFKDHAIIAGGLAYGWDTTSKVEEARLNISGEKNNLDIDVDIYSGGLIGNVQGTTTQAIVDKAVVNIEDAEINKFYGLGAKMSQTAGGQPWNYTVNDNAIVDTALTLKNVVANLVNVQKGSVTLSGKTTVNTLDVAKDVVVAMSGTGNEVTTKLNNEDVTFDMGSNNTWIVSGVSSVAGIGTGSGNTLAIDASLLEEGTTAVTIANNEATGTVVKVRDLDLKGGAAQALKYVVDDLEASVDSNGDITYATAAIDSVLRGDVELKDGKVVTTMDTDNLVVAGDVKAGEVSLVETAQKVETKADALDVEELEGKTQNITAEAGKTTIDGTVKLGESDYDVFTVKDMGGHNMMYVYNDEKGLVYSVDAANGNISTQGSVVAGAQYDANNVLTGYGFMANENGAAVNGTLTTTGNTSLANGVLTATYVEGGVHEVTVQGNQKVTGGVAVGGAVAAQGDVTAGVNEKGEGGVSLLKTAADLSKLNDDVIKTNETLKTTNDNLTKLNGDVERIDAQVTENTEAIAAETEARKKDIVNVTDHINTVSTNVTEHVNAVQKDLSAAIQAETAAREEHVNAVQKDLSAAINANSAAIESNAAAIEANSQAIAIETAERKADIQNVTNHINTVQKDLSAAIDNVSANVTSHVNAVQKDLSAAINAETAAREEHVNAVQKDLSAAIQENSQAIATETEARKADVANVTSHVNAVQKDLSNAIQAETAAREEHVNAVQKDLSSAIQAETAAREEHVNAVQKDLSSAIQENTAAISAEEQARIAGDEANAAAISNNAEAISGLNQRIGKMNGKINKVGAGAAALAALHPLDYDPDDKLTFSAGVGNYAGENAMALGAFYRPDEKLMFSLGGTMGNGENMVNLGVSIGLDGAKGTPKLSKKELVQKVSTMEAENQAIKAENEALEERVAKLEALVAKLAEK